MKKLLLAICMVLLFTGTAMAQQYLCCEAQAGANTYNLQIDGSATWLENLPFVPVTHGNTDYHCIYDVGTLGQGEHTFVGVAVDVSGWEGPVSVPFVASRPGAIASMKILKNP